MKKNTSATLSQPTKAFLDNPAGCLFHKAWSNEALKTVPSEDKWFINESIPCYKGVMDRSPSLIPGEIVKSQRADGRRLIFIGTRFGNVVIFDRYPGQVKDGFYMKLVPDNRVFYYLLGVGEASPRDVELAVHENIGLAVELMAKDFDSLPF